MEDQVEKIKAVKDMFATELELWKGSLQMVKESISRATGDSLLASTTLIFLSQLPYH